MSEVTLKVDSAADVSAVADFLKEAVALIGADVGTFFSRTATSFRFFLACDPHWYVEYERCAWYADDPWLEYAAHHAEPILACDIPVRDGPQADIVRIAKRYGFDSVVVVPAPAGRDLKLLGVLCLGSRQPEYFDPETLPALGVAALPLAASLLSWSTREARDELLRSVRLTPDDLVLLELDWRGVSTKEIAKVLDSSPSAIHSRFQRVKAKLGVRSRKKAAQLAAEYGLI
ncbi:MAG: LuxR C-terminal-related transcriptional regulator [Burkholderiales bacterium]|nr:LuxR C-terminal-related transcriptional regulator [Burkholderiales bacterium]